MRKRINKTISTIGSSNLEEKNKLPFSYPVNQDIYNKSHLESGISPEVLANQESTSDILIDENDINNDIPENDLDVPGSELDDQQEKIGSEDEENNYYSIGGDRHDDLEEDNA